MYIVKDLENSSGSKDKLFTNGGKIMKYKVEYGENCGDWLEDGQLFVARKQQTICLAALYGRTISQRCCNGLLTIKGLLRLINYDKKEHRYYVSGYT